ncbi:MAG: 1-deoxy-D-xylulose-5-phosphate reductoisomerase [SAR324 cluster bacterium]|nr:1-deoxy-D-xylulose-5-phosphate reductoisomerase [SAR324 cluster bacterium]
MNEKTLTVLGSTGSIGVSVLDVVARHRERYPIHALAAHSNVERMAAQIETFRPKVAVMFDGEAAQRLRELRPRNGRTAVLVGMEGLLEVASAPETDHVVAGIVGAVGLLPAHAAIEAGKEVSLANKEVLVLAGELMVSRARETGAVLLPMDSEHNAVFQCLGGSTTAPGVERVVLTASGGPFRDLAPEAFGAITLEQALAHPNWKMGPKITIDSATMMNKGLEVIEARWLFGLPPEKIEVLIHRQSIVHALVEFEDGSVIAQLGLPDMRTPIAACLAYPERIALRLPRLDLTQVGKLEFEAVPRERYPAFFLALEAMHAGGGVPALLNGANETVVAAYLDHAFPFTEIAAILEKVMRKAGALAKSEAPPPCLAAIRGIADAIEADALGRSLAAETMAETRSRKPDPGK